MCVRSTKGYAYANPNGAVSFHVVSSFSFRSLWIEVISHYRTGREGNPLILLIASHFTCTLQSASCRGRFIISKQDTQYWKSRVGKPPKAHNYSSTHAHKVIRYPFWERMSDKGHSMWFSSSHEFDIRVFRKS